MKLLLPLLFAVGIFSAAPFQPHVEKRFKLVETERQVRSVLSINANLASGDTAVIGSLPVNAVLLGSKLYIQTQLVSASDNTISIGCESATDLLPATDLTVQASGVLLIPLNVTSASGSSSVIEDGCSITVTVGAGTTGIDSGKFIFYVNYIIGGG